jgi:hypothetical protein
MESSEQFIFKMKILPTEEMELRTRPRGTEIHNYETLYRLTPASSSTGTSERRIWSLHIKNVYVVLEKVLTY